MKQRDEPWNGGNDRRKCGRRATDKRGIGRYAQGWRKYFLLFGLLLIVGGFLFFAYAYPEYEDARVREKALDRQQEVNLLSGIADLLVENAGTVDGLTYKDILLYSLKYMETEFTSTFAQLYAIDDEDDENPLVPLMELSQGVGGGQKHNPLDYPEFKEAVKNNEFGSLTYWYETEQAGGRDVHMTFRKVPTDPSHTARYVIAVAISKYSVSERIAGLIKACTIIVFVGAVACIVVAELVVCNPENRLKYPKDDGPKTGWTSLLRLRLRRPPQKRREPLGN